MLEAFFSPKALAVVGASRDEAKLGHAVLQNILRSGYPGQIFPINPKAEEILGLKCYPSVSAVPSSVDLAVIVVPAQVVADVVRDCATKKVKAAIIITAGFREVGPEGARMEREMIQLAQANGLRIIGPNCLGVVDTHTPLNATFSASMPPQGHIAFMSQSGALSTAILDWAEQAKVGFSKFVSLGNKADVTEVDLLNDWQGDVQSRAIIGYLEGINNGRRFMEAAARVTREKPLILVKGGGTSAGSRAVSSHTGSLAGSDAAYNAAFQQTGVIRARSMEQLFDLSVAFAYQPLPAGRRLAIITNAGGPGIIASDACERAGLEMASFSPATVEALRKRLPSTANLYNPIDVVGDARVDRYEAALEAAAQDPGVDSLLVLLTPQAMTEVEETARAVVRTASLAGKKPVLASFMGGPTVEPGIIILREGHVPNYPFPERAVATLAAMYQQHLWQEQPQEQPVRFNVEGNSVRRILQRARESGRLQLGDIEAHEVISAYGLPTPRCRLADSANEAVRFAEELGLPVVLKIVSPDILHKSDVQGVQLGLSTRGQVRNAYATIVANARHYMPEAEIWGVCVQEMVRKGREVILGVGYDAQFGHLLMFGLGGIYVEVLKDVTFRVAPVTPWDARSMLREIHSHLLLTGVRGEPPADTEAIVDCLLRLSQLITDFPEIVELDINPLMVAEQGQGARAVDCRITLAPQPGKRSGEAVSHS